MLLVVLIVAGIALLNAGSQAKNPVKRFAGAVNSEDADALVCFAFIIFVFNFNKMLL